LAFPLLYCRNYWKQHIIKVASLALDRLDGDRKLGAELDLPRNGGKHQQGRLTTDLGGMSRIRRKLEVLDELDEERLVFINTMAMFSSRKQNNLLND
jgi:hypothetical protein